MSKENKTPKPTKEEKRAAAEQARAARQHAQEEMKRQALAEKEAKKQAKRLKKGGEAQQAQNGQEEGPRKPTKKELCAWTKEAREEWKKLSRKERKLRMEEQLYLEKQLIAEGKIRPRGNYRPRGAFWRMFATMLAFFFGIFGAVGGLAGTVAYVGSKGTTRELLESLGLRNVDSLLTEPYYNLTPIKLAQELVGKLGSMPINSLETLSEISPLIPHYLGIAQQELAELGVHVSTDDLSKVQFTDLSEYLWNDVVPTVVLGEVLQLNYDVTMDKLEDQALFYTLCYGTFGSDYEIETASAAPASYSPAEGEQTEPTGGTIKMIGDSKPATMDDLLGEGENKGINNLLNKRSLGSALGLDINITEEKLQDSSMLYTLCYGTRGEDFEVENGRLRLLNGAVPTSFERLIDESSPLLDELELGSMLGLDTQKELERRKDNALMYALAYGTEGTDYTVTADYKIEMLQGKKPKTVGDMTKDSTEIVNGIVLDSMLDIGADSDAMMRYIAYGPEMAKGMALAAAEGEEAQPWEKRGDEYYDAEGKRVDEYGYLLNDDGSYLTENIIGEDNVPTDKLQYAGGGRYVIKAHDDGTKYIEMLPDLEKNDGSLYAKKTLGDLTDDDDLLDGMKIGDIANIDGNSSGLMQSIKDWSIDDLKDQEKIESLVIGDVMKIEPDENGKKPEGVSNIMWALRTRSIGDLQDQETIDNLKLGDVLEITPDSTGILKAMSNWAISDLGKQERINRLRLGQVLTVNESSSRLMKAMEHWRIGDLTKQEKIDSLTLADVLEIKTEGPDASPKILQSLANEPIGSLGTNINTMRLSDILEESDFEGNKILRNLKMSSLETLSNDVKALSVKDVFGDELYSFMEIKGGESYLEAVKAYDPVSQEGHGNRPDLYELAEGQTVETYYTHEKEGAKTPVSLVWFDAAGNHYENGDVYRGTRTAQGVPEATEYYYFVKSHATVEATFTWNYVDEADGFALKALPESDTVGKQSDAPDGVEVAPYEGTDGYKESGEQLYYFTAAGDVYPLLTDGYDVYYTFLRARSGEDPVEVRVDLEQIATYTKGGEPVDAAKVLKGEEGYYIVEEKEVMQKWCGADFTVYEEKEGAKIAEHYRTTKDGKIVELDRYLAGVWALLFAHIEYDVGEGSTNTGKVTGITDKTDRKILDISEDITNVASVISSTELWKLYLFRILEKDPYVDIASLDITLYQGTDNAKPISNLNQCDVVECIELVIQLTEKLSGTD